MALPKTLFEYARIQVNSKLSNALDIFQLQLPRTVESECLLHFRNDKLKVMLEGYRLPEKYIYSNSENVPIIRKLMLDGITAGAKFRFNEPLPWSTICLLTMCDMEPFSFWLSTFKIIEHYYEVTVRGVVFEICEKCLHELVTVRPKEPLHDCWSSLNVTLQYLPKKLVRGVIAPPLIRQYTYWCSFCANTPLFRSVRCGGALGAVSDSEEEDEDLIDLLLADF